MRKVNSYFTRLRHRIRENRRQFLFYTVLRILVIVTMVRCCFVGEFENVGLCILSLVLFMMPSLIEDRFRLEIPKLFETIIYLFIFSSGILGEIQNYYELIPGWDTMLHTMNGFLCAAVGFSMVDLLNRSSTKIDLSPKYVALVAFCFSMTIGIIWEFIEFSMDWIFHLDMQKDTIITAFSSVKLGADPGHLKRVHGVAKTVIECANGETITVKGGYLDIGLIDTMKDLFVNFFGALAFTIIGYNYIVNRSDRNIAPEFLIRRRDDDEGNPESDEAGAADRADAGTGAAGRMIGGPALTAWITLLLSYAAAILLYPVGNLWLDVMLIISIVCITAGLLMFLLTPKVKPGLRIWTAGSIAGGAVTLMKWVGAASPNLASVLMYFVIIMSDFFLMVFLWHQYRHQSKEPGGGEER